MRNACLYGSKLTAFATNPIFALVGKPKRKDTITSETGHSPVEEVYVPIKIVTSMVILF